MAVKGFTQADSKSGTTKKKADTPKKASGSPRPSFTNTGKAGGMRYGDTAGSVNSMATKTPWAPNPSAVNAGAVSGNPYGGGQPYTPPVAPYVPPSGGGSIAPVGPGGQANNSGYNWVGQPTPDATTGAPMTGAGSDYGYTPQGLGMLYQNPVPLAQDVLGGAGIDNYGMALALSDAMNPALYAYMMQTQGMGDQSDAATIDFISNYMNQMVTPGGSMPGMADLMTNVLGSDDVNSSPLAMMLSGIPPEDQVKVLANFLSAAGYGNNPLAQRAYGNAADYYGNDYLGGVMKGDPGGNNYASYLQGGPLAKWMGIR